MANCYWQEECDSWNHELLYKDGIFMGPWLHSEEAAVAAGMQYPCYTPAAVPPWAQPFAGEGAASGSRSHSEAEKRRRERINAQLSTLRKLIPKSEKMDKAAILGHAIEHVKELSKKAKEVSKISTIPTEIDEVSIDFFNEQEEITSRNNENIYIKASICCDDRPELYTELNSAFKGLGLITVEADMTSLGGRVKNIFVLCAKNKIGEERNSCMANLRHSLKVVLTRIVLSSGGSSYSVRSKRQRFFFS